MNPHRTGRNDRREVDRQLELRPDPSLLTPTSSPTDRVKSRSLSNFSLPVASLSPEKDRTSVRKEYQQLSSYPSQECRVDSWLEDSWKSRRVQTRAKDPESLTEIPPDSPLDDPILTLRATTAQGGDMGPSPSQSTATSGKPGLATAAYRDLLKDNEINIDTVGDRIPKDVDLCIDKHIRNRSSSRLNDQQLSKIRSLVKKLSDKNQTLLCEKLLESDLFPLRHKDIEMSGDTLWSARPVPHCASALPLALPKPDRYYGFLPSRSSTWAREALLAANHPDVTQETRPTRRAICPSFMIEVNAECTGGTIYAGENQVAGAGAHRVKSTITLLDKANPTRTRSNTDAMVFSTVISHRTAVSHVHYFDIRTGQYCMAFIDDFVLLREPQRCHDFHKSIQQWLVDVQQPFISKLLARLLPLLPPPTTSNVTTNALTAANPSSAAPTSKRAPTQRDVATSSTNAADTTEEAPPSKRTRQSKKGTSG